jgi:hypothetical protein
MIADSESSCNHDTLADHNSKEHCHDPQAGNHCDGERQKVGAVGPLMPARRGYGDIVGSPGPLDADSSQTSGALAGEPEGPPVYGTICSLR